MGNYFGTDGYRGKVGEDLTAENAYHVGRFLGAYIRRGKRHRPRVALGRDTRLSGAMLECALVAGLCASGADAYLLGVTSTPCISFVCEQGCFDAGIMISASHNPYDDNGIKLFDGAGEKMDDELVCELERYLDEVREHRVSLSYATEDAVGTVYDGTREKEAYINHLKTLLPISLTGYTLALDCANGSTASFAGEVFSSLGATVHLIGVHPDGTNINEHTGSTHIETLASYVKAHRIDIGFAFDGDGDRCLAVDVEGRVVTGDHILYLLARHLHARGRLAEATVVATVMSNFGLHQALARHGISTLTTAVGDRYVYECMRERGLSLGGESSGHIILSDDARTGDGILTALRVMEAVVTSGVPLSALTDDLHLLPQVVRSVRVKEKKSAISRESLCRTVASIRKSLSGSGRLLVRESGTEPLIRVMVEASSEALAEQYVYHIE